MNNIKSQDVKTHAVLMYKGANMLFGHLACKPLTCIQTVIYWNMDMITAVSHTVTYNVVHIERDVVGLETELQYEHCSCFLSELRQYESES